MYNFLSFLARSGHVLSSLGPCPFTTISTRLSLQLYPFRSLLTGFTFNYYPKDVALDAFPLSLRMIMIGTYDHD